MPPALLLPALSLLSAWQKDKFEGHVPACPLPTAANMRPTYGQLWRRGCLEVSWTTDVDTPEQAGPFPPRRTAPLRFPAAPPQYREAMAAARLQRPASLEMGFDLKLR